MAKFAILLGSAPEDFRQKKIEEMYDFLDSKRGEGDSIVTFANGISEMMLEMVMDNSIKQLKVDSGQFTEKSGQKARHCEPTGETISESVRDCFVADAPRNDGKSKSNSILLYICTLRPVAEDEKTFWLGGEEIRRDVIRHYEELAAECGIDMQVIFDSDSEMVSEEELGYEKVNELESIGR